MTLLAAIYTRISRDHAGAQASTARQERLCREWVALQGWQTVGVFEDLARSAFDPAVVRDAYEDLLELVVSRRVNVVVCWRLDRLARSPGEFERFWAACQSADVGIASATEPVDSSSPVGVALVRMLVTFAGLESDVRSIRLRAKNREVAERGGPSPGCPPYGYGPGCRVIIESEAALVREAASRVLGGEVCAAIARDWAARGVAGRSGRPWSPSGIRKMLRGRAICGDRALNGVVAAEGCWPAILDPLVGAQVRNRLAGRDGRAARQGRTDHVLRGLMRCGLCNERLVVESKIGVPLFLCRMKGCRGVSVLKEPTEDWITATVLARISARHAGNHRVRWRRRDAGAAIASLDAITQALYGLNSAYFVRGELTHPEWLRARDELIWKSLNQIARAMPQRHPRGMPPAVPIWRAGEIWAELAVPARREVMLAELARVIVHPSPNGARMWHPDRFEFVWVQPGPLDESVSVPVPIRHVRLWEYEEGRPRRPSRAVPSATELRELGRPLRVVEVCRLTGLSRTTVNKARQRGALTGEFVRGMWIYHIEEVDRWRSATRKYGRYARPDSATLVDQTEAAERLGVSSAVVSQLVEARALIPSVNGSDGPWFSIKDLASAANRPSGK